MRFIPTFIHGILDFIVALTLIFAPTIFGFADVDGAAVIIPRVIGVILLLSELMTDFELGILKVIPMPMHLTLDLVAGILLAASPWIFGFSDAFPSVWMPHVIVGLMIVALSLITHTQPRRANAR